jgi:hypothetical protein
MNILRVIHDEYLSNQSESLSGGEGGGEAKGSPENEDSTPDRASGLIILHRRVDGGEIDCGISTRSLRGAFNYDRFLIFSLHDIPRKVK